MMTYDATSVRAYFDGLAGREWERLETTVQGRNNYAVHRRLLDRYARAGMRVLDIGSGPGRYAIDLAALGAEVTVADLSQVQLDLARERIAERGLVGRIAGFHRLDVLHLAGLEAESYDLVVCYGGVLSYTRERHPDALRELARVVRPGGVVLASVMSLYGALRLLGPLDAAAVLETIDAHLDHAALLAGTQIAYTRPTSGEFHQPLALFTSVGLRGAMADAGLAVEAMASANPLLAQFQTVPRMAESARAADALLALELAACEHPGLLDAGGHLIAAARRPTTTATDGKAS
jgi:2-polyprenyl-3-methyl-5-hydroxy-6-metoxy-1,4-benzoquinol methylase